MQSHHSTRSRAGRCSNGSGSHKASVSRRQRPRPSTQLSAVPEVINQLASVEPSSMSDSVQSLVADLLSPIPDLPPHFGTLAVKAKAAELLNQLQAVGSGLAATPELQQVLGPVVDTWSSLDAQRVSLLQQLDSATKAVTAQLSPAVSAPLQMVGAQWQSAMSEASAPLSAAAGHAGDLHVQPHWGTAAVQEAIQRVEGSGVGEWGSSLTQMASAAAEMVSSGGAAGLQPAAAVEAASQQLRQVVELLASAPQGFMAGNPQVSAVLNDLRVVLASLPTSTTFNGSVAAAAAASGAAAYAGWPPAAVQLAESLRVAVESGQWAGHNLAVLALAAAGVAVAVGWSARVAPTGVWGSADTAHSAEEELGYEYDPVLLDAYVRRRPVLVMQRAAQVATEMSAFGLALLSDLSTGQLQANEPARARQLRFAIERLGPAYVKVAQALSTRVDLLTPAYFEQIQLLQDQVPPFPCEVARTEMVTAFGGRPIESVLSSLTDKPVAAASLGQVYKGTLVPELGGYDVAVKVQRPGVLSAVALDLALIRWLAQATSEQMSSDWVSIIDAWAVRFFHEMDYEREADNAERFAKDMEQIQGITVPAPVRSLSNHNVLTSRWVDGERLGQSQAADVRQLCDTLLTAYLVQLLDTGFLHADPHPGNLLRTPEGRIAVLDYGLMTEVTEAQRWALLEYIAHLSTRDWEALAFDLQVLGFIPPDVDPRERGLVEPLGRIMSQLVGGGGAAKVNIDKVITELEQLGETYPFQIPAFFALILRAFSVIEGIALEVDPDYAIVAECFPYLSRRLLADDSPRARALLRELLYGNKQRLDVDRLLRLAEGFAAYNTDGLVEETEVVTVTSVSAAPATAAAASSSSSSSFSSAGNSSVAGGASSSPALRRMLANAGMSASDLPGASRPRRPEQQQAQAAGGSKAKSPVVDGAVRDALLTVFSRRGSYVQELLVEEAAAAVDALSVSALAALLMTLVGAAPAIAGPSDQQRADTGAQGLPSSPTAVLAMAMNTLAGAASGTGLLASGPAPGALALLPPSVWARVQPLVQLTDDDREALAVVQGLAQLLLRAAGSSTSSTSSSAAAAVGSQQRAGQGVRTTTSASVTLGQIREAISELAPLLPEMAPGLALTARQFIAALAGRARARLVRAMRGEPLPPPTSTRTTTTTTTSNTYTAATTTSSASSNGTVTTTARRDFSTTQATQAAGKSSKGSMPAQKALSQSVTTPAQQQQQKSVRVSDPWSAERLLGSGARIDATAASMRVGK